MGPHGPRGLALGRGARVTIPRRSSRVGNVQAPARREPPGAWPNPRRGSDMAKRTCSVDGCARVHYAFGWCNLHWQRWQRTGNPLNPGRIVGDDEARWISKVDCSDPTGCWPWMGAPQSNGYGHFRVGGRGSVPQGAHRWGYEHFVGPVRRGLTLDHLCRNRLCVNFDHLEPVSLRVNTLRGTSFSAINARKTHCNKGHPFDNTNTYIHKGRRRCRMCCVAAQRRYLERHT